MRTTIKDIAERVGVSKSLVSMYLNNHPIAERIAEKTKRKIDVAVREMDYQPSITARALAHGKSQTIGLVIGQISGVYSCYFAETLLSEAEKYGYQLLISITRYNQDKERECLRSLVSRQVDGILYHLGFDPALPIPRFLQNTPFLNVVQVRDESNSLVMDDAEALPEILKQLHLRNCRKIVVASRFNRMNPGDCIDVDGIRIQAVTSPVYAAQTMAEFRQFLREENADAVYFGSSTEAAEFIRAIPSDDLPYLFYSYTLPYDYMAHPRILGVTVNPFRPFIAAQVKRLHEMIEHPERTVQHLSLPTRFLDADALKACYDEQLTDPYFKNIVAEHGNVMSNILLQSSPQTSI